MIYFNCCLRLSLNAYFDLIETKMTLGNKTLEQFIDLIAKRQANEPFLDLSERKIQNVVFFHSSLRFPFQLLTPTMYEIKFIATNQILSSNKQNGNSNDICV